MPEKLTNFISGKHVPPVNGNYLDLIEPGTGLKVADVPDSAVADVNAAVAAAQAAFPAWSATPALERSRILSRIGALLEANKDKLAAAESRDTGKPISLAREVDIPRTATNFNAFAGIILNTSSDFHAFDRGGVPGAMDTEGFNYTLRKPRGVAGLIAPWNLPLYLLTWKIAPALATGNTAVCKPSEVTPTTASMLADLCNEAGLPAGVLNIVHGRGQTAGGALVTHPDVPTISFTGSTAVGRWIGKECGDRLKRVSLELGGKNPFVVFADADLDKAVTTAARAAFSNQGQICLCGSRLLLHESIADKFTADLVARAKALTPGDPSDPATRFGALTGAAHLQKVDGMVRQACELGGRVLCGGAKADPALLPARCKGGSYYLPTVIEGLDPTCAIEQEEIFGPVVTIQRFKTDDEAVKLANGTCYGLASTIFTRDLNRAHAMAARIESGLVWVNCWMVRDLRTPFGGMKQSGVGREGGQDAIKFFTEPKNVCIGL
ncbi:MAG TPA: aldehyde dehydrogenase [Phycisphaerales bacterium]|nr:aldehyde dehydrogenase [Phycisphaerales bacterium]